MTSTIGVKKIQYPNGTDILTLDSSGALTVNGAFTSQGIDDNANANAITINSSEQVGIGTTNPDGTLHVHTGSAGSVTALSDADDFVVENSGNGGISVLTPDANRSALFLGHASDNLKLQIRHDGATSLAQIISDDALTFHTGDGSERMRIDTSGRIGMGSSNNGAYHANVDDLVIEGDGSRGITIRAQSGHQSAIAFADGTTGNEPIQGRIMYNHNGDTMSFFFGTNEKVRISSTGNIDVGDTSNNAGIKVYRHLQSYNAISLQNGTNNDGQIFQSFLRSNGSVVGSISQTAGGAQILFNTSSDYRLKENVSYDFDATSRLKQLKPARFNWIEDDTNTTFDGFLAHEVSSVVPEAITGTKDATEEFGTVKDKDENIIEKNVSETHFKERQKETTDADGNKEDAAYPSTYTWKKTSTENVYQTIDQSKLVPLLVKTIQELEARITTLENK